MCSYLGNVCVSCVASNVLATFYIHMNENIIILKAPNVVCVVVFTPTVNSYGHVRMVSSFNHTFHGQA